MIPCLGWILFWKDRQILDFFKAWLTYPRTGYARPPEDPAPDQDLLADFLRIRAPERHNELLTLRTARALDENVTSFKARTVYLFLVAFMVAQLVQGRWSVAILMVRACQ